MRKTLKILKYYVWAFNGYFGLKSRTHLPQKATILLTYFNEVRMKHINNQLRNILKCDIIRQVIISNHNPEIDIRSMIKVRDTRIKVINQIVRRGCGHRWLVANEFSPEYLIVVDDDILIFPWQLRQLFKALVAEPEIPHGFAGMFQHDDGFLEYRQEEERSLHYICEIYAITGTHLNRFMEIRKRIVQNESLRHMVEFSVDFMIISCSGRHEPKIHDAGKLFRCPTYNETGIAVHKNNDFTDNIPKFAKALKECALLSGYKPANPFPLGESF